MQYIIETLNSLKDFGGYEEIPTKEISEAMQLKLLKTGISTIRAFRFKTKLLDSRVDRIVVEIVVDESKCVLYTYCAKFTFEDFAITPIRNVLRGNVVEQYTEAIRNVMRRYLDWEHCI